MGKIRRRADFAEVEVLNVKLTFLDDAGNRVQEPFTVVYRSYSKRGAERLEQEMESEKTADGTTPFAVLFPRLIASIIDQDGEPLTDDSGEPATLTREFYDGLLAEDLRTIFAAIGGSENPPQDSSAPGASGSGPAASAE